MLSVRPSSASYRLDVVPSAGAKVITKILTSLGGFHNVGRGMKSACGVSTTSLQG